MRQRGFGLSEFGKSLRYSSSYKGDRIPTFDELKRRAAALPPRFTVDPASLPSVGDVSDDDGDEVAVFSKTDFDTLE